MPENGKRPRYRKYVKRRKICFKLRRHFRPTVKDGKMLNFTQLNYKHVRNHILSLGTVILGAHENSYHKLL